MRAGKSALTTMSPEAAAAHSAGGVFGTNTGNLLFSGSMERALSVPGTQVVPDSFELQRQITTSSIAGRINSEFDALVLPLANAFRPEFLRPLRKLTEIIKKVTIPVVVTGVGAQLSIDGGRDFECPPEVKEATLNFVSAVLDRSASIGVRGEITRDFLKQIGFAESDVDVIGCPSLFMNGPTLAVKKSVAHLAPSSALAINGDPRVPGAPSFINSTSDAYSDTYFVGQSHAELALLLWGTPSPGAEDCVTHTGHPLYKADRFRVFTDAHTWFEFLRERDFSIGSRLHGTVASLVAGTPAMLLAWDSRTLELADYHQMPYRLTPDLSDLPSTAELYDEVDFTGFNRHSQENFDRFVSFLSRNSLPNIYESPDSESTFDERIESLSFHRPATTLYGENATDELLDRLRWLRQGPGTEVNRRFHGYQPPFAVKTPSKVDVAADKAQDALLQAKSLSKRVEDLEKRLSGANSIVSKRWYQHLPTPIKKIGRRLLRR